MKEEMPLLLCQAEGAQQANALKAVLPLGVMRSGFMVWGVANGP